MAALLSYHGDQAVKKRYLDRITAHEAADELVKGQYWQNGKGCAVGCLVHCNDGFRIHSLFPTADGPGWPEWLARLADTLFEGLPKDHAKTFPRRLVEAIPVGVDLDRVRYRFALVLLAESSERVKGLGIDADLKAKVLAAVEGSASLNREAAKTGKWDESAASAASAARSAASAAWSAAESAAELAASAAWSAESAVAAYIRYADALIVLLQQLALKK